MSKGICTIPLSDITGESTPEKIQEVYSSIVPEYPNIEFGFHLHTAPDKWREKIEAAFESGCRRFDSVMGGMGGCPMTGYELLANLDTRNLIGYAHEKNIRVNLDISKFKEAEGFLSTIQ